MQDLGRVLSLCIPCKALACVRYASLSETFKKVSVLCELCQSSFHLRHNVTLVCYSDLVSDIGVDNISRTAEVSDHGNGTRRKGFKDYTCTVVTK